MSLIMTLSSRFRGGFPQSFLAMSGNAYLKHPRPKIDMKSMQHNNSIIRRSSLIRPPNQEGAIYKFMMKERYNGMTITQSSFHLSSLCSVAAFLCTDMLELRTLALTSSCFLGAFQYWRPLPLYPQIMKWNAFFCSINVVMMGVLLKEMYDAENLPDEM